MAQQIEKCETKFTFTKNTNGSTYMYFISSYNSWFLLRIHSRVIINFKESKELKNGIECDEQPSNQSVIVKKIKWILTMT